MSDQTVKDMLGRKGLIKVSEAQKLLLTQLRSSFTEKENVELAHAFGRVLADDITAPEDLPLHPRSTMDGYAVRAADTFGASDSMPCYLEVKGEIFMGKEPAVDVLQGSCVKIPTGGLLPAGADSVVMLEHTITVDESMVEVVKSVGSGTNLIHRGEDIAGGAKALAKGHLLRPQDIGLLAGLGIPEVSVYRKVRVGIMSTGDEIVDHSSRPAPGQIRNINTLALAGQVLQAGAEWQDYGIVSDREEVFMPAMEKAVGECDIVLFSGGSSVGVRDLGEQIVEKLGPPGILVHGVTLKPGKPILIGLSGNTPVFGLPGHPVSAMVCFDYFVRPAIHSLSGLGNAEKVTPSVQAKLTRNINSAAGRRDVVRVELTKNASGWTAAPILGKSGSISTLSRANGYFEIDEDSQGLNENSLVEVYLYL